MNAGIVVGVGNIYASEALYLAGIHPKRAAGRVSRLRMHGLSESIKTVLRRAIKAGGTTLRDFHGGDGEPGYFKQKLEVYGRDGEPCRRCNTDVSVSCWGSARRSIASTASADPLSVVQVVWPTLRVA